MYLSSNKDKLLHLTVNMQWSLILLFLMGQCCFSDCQLYEYLYIKEEKTWTEAQQYCREKHTDLATVSNMTDMKRLLNISAGGMKDAWIGLYDPTDVSEHGSLCLEWSSMKVRQTGTQENRLIKDMKILRTDDF
ncbi:hypothetical protein GOODEAATRI_030657 [Goodea atripinnis]|uniref:C-type lectin domain-containing protein n=1 Tax=Goodea atripinnis TaxID=208336 RepID=A0ABV0P930_9TELE